jgi:hypothetical protein
LAQPFSGVSALEGPSGLQSPSVFETFKNKEGSGEQGKLQLRYWETMTCHVKVEEGISSKY